MMTNKNIVAVLMLMVMSFIGGMISAIEIDIFNRQRKVIVMDNIIKIKSEPVIETGKREIIEHYLFLFNHNGKPIISIDKDYKIMVIPGEYRMTEQGNLIFDGNEKAPQVKYNGNLLMMRDINRMKEEWKDK